MVTRRHRHYGLLIGFVFTLLSVGLTLRLGDTLERQSFDLRVRGSNRVAASDRILHVDIDDGSLERIGRWPWPRDVLGDLLRTLHELGATTIAVDLLLDDAERMRLHLPDAGMDSGEAGDTLARVNRENVVQPDLELADAIRRSGNVVMGVSFEMRRPGEAPPPLERALALLNESPGLSTEQLAQRVGAGREDGERLWIAARTVQLLSERFDLDEVAIGGALDRAPDAVRRVLAGAKRRVGLDRAAAFLAAHPDGTADEFIAWALPGATRETRTADTTDLRKAYALEAARRALDDKLPAVPANLGRALATAQEVIAPRELLGRAAAGMGFVVFTFDPDGKLREVPLLADHRGRVVPQLGLAVAARELGLDLRSARFTSSGWLEIPVGDGGRRYRLQTDDRDRFVIPWTATGTAWRIGRDFRHIAASSVLTIARNRRLVAENQRRIDLASVDVLSATKGELSASYAHKCAEWLDLSYQQRTDALAGRDTEPAFAERASRIAELRSDIDQELESAVSMVTATLEEIRNLTPASDAERAQFAAYHAAGEAIDRRIVPLRAANARLAERIEQDIALLRPIVSGKVAFVGYTATAHGDFVSSPIDPSLPGVIVHANVLNAFLQDAFIFRPSLALQAALAVLVGLAVTAFTATRGPILTLAGVLLLLAAYAALNAFVLFAVFRIWAVMWLPVAAAIVPWAAVTAYRQLTEERQRRLIQNQLAEFTSPALARRIAEDPAAAAALQRVENREVTCFFSDLAGFTSIAEQADSARVQHVLNTYLDRMSEVLFRHEAFLNKFLGDGIMAFFNPNVNPQPDHARRACAAAIESFEALERLQSELTPSDELFGRLRMRIGIASGIGGVGRFGSHRKADYTVIGDVANLAARLEPANKVFGTRLIVSGPTRELVKDLYEWRYLAELQVKGKRQTVPVFEIVSRAGEASADRIESCRRFEAAVELYKQRRWDEAIVAFMRILSRQPDDAGASAYVDACQEKKLFPPEDDWNGALELKEK